MSKLDTNSQPLAEEGNTLQLKRDTSVRPDDVENAGSPILSAADDFDDSFLSDTSSGIHDFLPIDTEPENANSEMQWQWAPLQDVDQIRVLEIEPSKDANDALVCRFQTTVLANPCPYMALSYRWGTTYPEGSHLNERIFCDNIPFRVTSHLLAGLRRVRALMADNQYTRHVWVDAICIDQQNFAEKNRQVMQMDRVYRNASQLVIWLGEPEVCDPPIYRYDLISLAKHINESEHEDGICGEYLSVKSKLYQQEYFRRLWVVQEVTLCRRAHLLLVGSLALQVMNATEMMLVDDENEARLQLAPLLFESTTSKADVLERSLLQNMIRYAGAGCTDDRDRLYALRSISSDGSSFQVDYRKTTEELYRNFAVRMVESGHTVELLRAASRLYSPLDGLSDQEPRGYRLQSWMPVWSRQAAHIASEDSSEDSNANYYEERPFQADLEDAKVDKTGTVLTLKGWLCKLSIDHCHSDPRRKKRYPWDYYYAQLPERYNPTGEFCFPAGAFEKGEEDRAKIAGLYGNEGTHYCVLQGSWDVFGVTKCADSSAERWKFSLMRWCKVAFPRRITDPRVQQRCLTVVPAWDVGVTRSMQSPIEIDLI